MVKSLSVMGIIDSDFPMSSITGRANLLLTTSIGGGVHAGIKKPGITPVFLSRFSPTRSGLGFSASVQSADDLPRHKLVTNIWYT